MDGYAPHDGCARHLDEGIRDLDVGVHDSHGWIRATDGTFRWSPDAAFRVRTSWSFLLLHLLHLVRVLYLLADN